MDFSLPYKKGNTCMKSTILSRKEWWPYDQGVPEHIPAGVYVFYACLQNYYLSGVALLHQ